MSLMYSCRKVAELLTQSLDEPLGLADRVRLRLHVALCGNCANVEKQLKGMRSLSADLFAGASVAGDELDSKAGDPS